MAMVIAAPAAAAVAVTGSGTVDMRFLNWQGPTLVRNAGGAMVANGWVNEVRPNITGILEDTGRGNGTQFEIGNIGVGTPSFPLTGPGTTRISMRYDNVPVGSIDENIISFAPAAFSNVAVGEAFRLGTFTFQNGGWFGAGAGSAPNVPTSMAFRIVTSSRDGAVFNQTRLLRLIMTVHSPFPNDTTTLAGQEAEADWITLFDMDNQVTLNSFRVYDVCCAPAGAPSTGTIDLMGRFGSLDILGFANPVGGFITETALPLAPVIPGGGGGGGGGVAPIPEPASWAMLIAGFGLVGAVQRRRRATRPAAGPEEGNSVQPV
jgi:hypothetical protein